MLRMPRGLWEDLEKTIIAQDRMFLMGVARELGLSIPDVLKKCLGTGTPQAVMVSAEPFDRCPWYDRLGDGLWMPCSRQRMTAVRPCCFHERPGPNASLSVDHLGIAKAYRCNDGRVYWSAFETETDADIFREDGTLVSEFTFRVHITEDGEKRIRRCF